MTCPVCCESYSSSDRKPYCLPCGHMLCAQCAARQVLCPECRKPYTQDQLRVVYDLIPDTDPPASDPKLRRDLETTLEEIAGRVTKAKARLEGLRTLREKVRFQNSDVKAKVANALDLAVDQLAKLKTQLIADLDSAESSNSEASERLETALQSQLKDCARAEARLKAASRSSQDLEEVQKSVLSLDSPRQAAFTGFTVKEDFGTEVLQHAAVLRTAFSATQVTTTTPLPPKKPAFTNKYVPVAVEKPPPRAVPQSARPRVPLHPPAVPVQISAPRWFYEYKGAKKAFTPDFSVALEQAYALGESWCELRDKQMRLIFEVNMRTWHSYRPGDRLHACAIGRDLV